MTNARQPILTNFGLRNDEASIIVYCRIIALWMGTALDSCHAAGDVEGGF